MDPRGAAPLTDDPAGALERLAAATGVAFPHLDAARGHTADRTESAAAKLATALPPEAAERLSVVAFGSWARAELTQGSDDDWAILAPRQLPADDPTLRASLDAARSELGGEARKPGAQEIFGVAFDVEGLIARIGLDADTNANLTRRLLLLLESTELYGHSHGEAVQTVLGRYLNHGVKQFRPPRFLLNDLVRYWRTICVDFEGKHLPGGDDPKWVVRNAKLRTSRKLVFAAGLVPLLLCHLKDRDEMARFLTGWLAAPPTDRLAEAFLHVEAAEAGARTLSAYDRWLAIMRDEAARSALRSLRQDTRDTSPLWQDIRVIGNEFERGLMSLLFGTRLAPLAQKYGLF